MKHKARRTTFLAVLLSLAGATAAFAAGPLGGKTYEGGAPTMGTNSEGHRVRTHASGNIVLHVAGNGRSVTVRFSSTSPVLYCVTQQKLHVQSAKAASISDSGSFTAAVSQRFSAGPGASAIVQVISGKFSGRSVHGTIRTHAAECSGVSYFSATAR